MRKTQEGDLTHLQMPHKEAAVGLINLIQIKLNANNICANVYADKWRLTERNSEPTCNSNNYTKKQSS